MILFEITIVIDPSVHVQKNDRGAFLAAVEGAAKEKGHAGDEEEGNE